MTEEILFTVHRDPQKGRCALASRDLAAGEVIFSELPFAYGPKSDSPPLCLGCLSPADGSVLCSRCSWPVCGLECENLPVHRQNECAVFSARNVKFQPVVDAAAACPQLECVTPLRVLLAKERDPPRWQAEVECMEAQDEARKSGPAWAFNQVNIVDFLRGPCGLDRFPAALVHTVCGVLEVNAFEARTPSGHLIRCLYPHLAILSHSCVSNVTHTIDSLGSGDGSDFRVAARAAIPVRQGGELHSSYTYSLWPTPVRRAFLQESKFFACRCERCADNTELGTFMSALKCSKCDNGIILASAPLDDSCDWKCTHCEFRTTSTAVLKVFHTIQAEVDAVEVLAGAEGIEARESIFRKYRSVLHPKNAYMTMLRVGLTQLYGRAEGYTTEELPDILFERKMELCTQLLEVLDVIEPGHTRLRGITLFELHVPMLMLARNMYNNGTIDKVEFREKMEKAVETLSESVEILKNESSTTPEGQLGLAAQQNLEGLRANFEMLIETA